jgi:branched-chain amino acid transport system substrate-binding protein
VADDRVMQVSPSSTSPALAEVGYDEVADVKYFGRTAPNDVDQGVVMGHSMETHMNADTAAFLHMNNVYGEELAAEARTSFNGETLQSVRYSPEATDYTSTLDRLFQGNPDAIGFIGYPESGRTILQTWADGDYGGQLVLSEGLNSTALFRDIPDVVEGMYVISPNPEPTAGTGTFREELGHEPVQFSANAYDALFLMALAMHRAGEASGTAVATNLRSVSQGDGVNVTVNEFQKATELLDEGNEINYQGASGAVDLNENLEPSTGFEILKIRDGHPEVVEQVPRTFFTEEQSPAPTVTARDETPTLTTVTDSTAEPLPDVDGNRETGILFPLLGAGSVGWMIGFFTGNTKSKDIKRSFLNVLLVAFGFGMLFVPGLSTLFDRYKCGTEPTG